MSFSASRSVCLLSVWALVLGGASACATESVTEDEEVIDDIDDALIMRVGGRVDATQVLSDENVEGDQDVTVEQVQALLEEAKSSLASYSVGGRTAATIIVEESKAQQISPVYMLARLQSEQGLVFRTMTGASYTRALSKATGCGCPDNAPCAKATSGFQGQVSCAAELMRRYLTNLDAGKTAIGGSAYIQPNEWKLGKTTRTLDRCYVRPKNRATAALYTYTPWVGKSSTMGCGTAPIGTSGVAIQYKKVKLNLAAQL